jgi:hypothetical protein
MNLRRTLSRLQTRVLEGVAARKQRYVPSEGYICRCDGKDLQLRPGERHYAMGHTLKAVKSLEQRGLLVLDPTGELVLGGAAVKAFRTSGNPNSSASLARRVITL